MKQRLFSTAAIAVVTLVAGFSAANAATVNVAQQNTMPNGTIFQDAAGNNAWQVSQTIAGSVGGTFNTGLFRLKTTGPDGVDFDAFCVDLFNTISMPATYMQDDFLFSGQTRQRINALVTNALPLVNNSASASAFQLALWEVITDDTLDLFDGNFRVTTNNSGARATAADWLTDITNGTWAPDNNTVFSFLKNETNQDLLVIGLGGPTPAPVPLPAAGWLLLAGIGALAAAKRRAA